MNDPQEIRRQADLLLSQMSVEEKAGQLTQYFYFGFLRDVPPEAAAESPLAKQPQEVEAALARGAAGSLLFVREPAEANRLQRLALAGSRHGIPLLFGFDVIHGFRTILPGIYAGGDCVSLGQDLTVQAVEHGKRAAMAIHSDIQAKKKEAA